MAVAFLHNFVLFLSCYWNIVDLHVVLVSDVQQSESVINIFAFFKDSFPI